MLTPERFARAAEIFHGAIDLAETARPGFLDSTCGGDYELRLEVEELLANAHDSADDFSESRLGIGAGAISGAIEETTGLLPNAIGRYRVTGLVGEGGMGRVYEAWQERPRRRVAIKVIRPEFDSPQVSRRFEQEAEILGSLRHPAIAQVIEGGEFEQYGGLRRFFAMEFVEGEPLVACAGSHRLGTRERMALIVQVCEGADHAHRQGVVHRDLKPGNILVDAAGRVKILDFGIARLAGESGQAATLQTLTGQVMGTVAYMSPEQIEGRVSEIDARADVYAIGVIAYELLTGRLPHDVAGVPVAEAARRIADKVPPRLSTIRRELAGDLDAIVGKCLEKEPARRYASAEEIAADIRRFLADIPVLARRPSSVDQFRKFARRNPGLVTAIGAAVVAMAAGTGFSTWAAVNATAARDEAHKEVERASSVTEILYDTVTSSHSSYTSGKEITLSEALEATRARIAAGTLKATPEAEALLWYSLGIVSIDRAKFDEAREQLTRSLEIRRRVLPADHIDIVRSLTAMGRLHVMQGQFREGAGFYRDQLAILRRTGPEGDEALCMYNLAQALSNLVMKDQATTEEIAEFESVLNGSIELHRRIRPEDHVSQGFHRLLQGRVAAHMGKVPEAMDYLQQSLERMHREFKPPNPRLASVLNEMGAVQMKVAKDATAAEPFFRDAYEQVREVFKDNPQHPMLDVIRSNYADCLRALGKTAEADQISPAAAGSSGPPATGGGG